MRARFDKIFCTNFIEKNLAKIGEEILAQISSAKFRTEFRAFLNGTILGEFCIIDKKNSTDLGIALEIIKTFTKLEWQIGEISLAQILERFLNLYKIDHWIDN